MQRTLLTILSYGLLQFSRKAIPHQRLFLALKKERLQREVFPLEPLHQHLSAVPFHPFLQKARTYVGRLFVNKE